MVLIIGVPTAAWALENESGQQLCGPNSMPFTRGEWLDDLYMSGPGGSTGYYYNGGSTWKVAHRAGKYPGGGYWSASADALNEAGTYAYCDAL